MKVYFTVDTESSMGGAWQDPGRRPLEAARHVFCRIGEEAFGIPLFVRIMAEYGCAATYFVETLATRTLGAADTQSIFDFLLSSGQDVQLHIHPTFRFYDEWRNARIDGREYRVPDRDDLIGRFPEELQMDFLREAAGYFEKFTGRQPEAFRAGCWAGSTSMLRCLRKLGILVDSSFNPCFHRETSFPGEDLSINRAQEIEGVWEIPATVAKTPLPEGANGFKYADCTSLSFAEIRAMLDAGAAGGLEHFVITFHSFSAVKAKDVSYSELRPNRIVIRRLEKMFRYLAENPSRFQVDTMGNFAENAGAFQPAARDQKLTELPLRDAAVRKAVQLINNAYWV